MIDQTCTQPWVTPDGAQVLVPLRDRIREVRDYVWSADVPTVTLPDSTTIPVPTPTPEVATVAVLNGTTRPGLAGTSADLLRAASVDVVYVGNADRQDYAVTQVITNRDKPRTLEVVLSALGLSQTAIVRSPDSGADYDILVVLGQDFEVP